METTFQYSSQNLMFVRSLAKAIIYRSTVLLDEAKLKAADERIERLRTHLPEVTNVIDSDIEVIELDKNGEEQTFDRKLLTLSILYYSDNLTLIEEIISAEASIDATDSDGNAALHVAARLGKTDVVKLLLSHKADLYLTNDQDETPLEISIERGNSETAELLERSAENALAAQLSLMV